MNLNQAIQKIPKPLLVGGVLVLALAFFVYNDPLRDECEVQSKIFDKNTKGILKPTKIKNKIQYPKINYWRELCSQGNSPGACEDYLAGLKLVSAELKSFKLKCQTVYKEENENFQTYLAQALKILPLLAWGEKPPEGLPTRQGWLTESHLKTFCALKNDFIQLAGEEQYLALRSQVYAEYPDQWPEKTPPEGRNPEERPKAMKSAQNPSGKLTAAQIYERSLFSIRCDLYM